MPAIKQWTSKNPTPTTLKYTVPAGTLTVNTVGDPVELIIRDSRVFSELGGDWSKLIIRDTLGSELVGEVASWRPELSYGTLFVPLTVNAVGVEEHITVEAKSSNPSNPNIGAIGSAVAMAMWDASGWDHVYHLTQDTMGPLLPSTSSGIVGAWTDDTQDRLRYQDDRLCSLFSDGVYCVLPDLVVSGGGQFSIAADIHLANNTLPVNRRIITARRGGNSVWSAIGAWETAANTMCGFWEKNGGNKHTGLVGDVGTNEWLVVQAKYTSNISSVTWVNDVSVGRSGISSTLEDTGQQWNIGNDENTANPFTGYIRDFKYANIELTDGNIESPRLASREVLFTVTEI